MKPKSRGRPKTTGEGTQIGMRWQEAELQAIDDWRREQADLPSRSEAIRRLVKRAVSGPQTIPGSNPGAAHKASKMAGGVIDQMADQSQPIEEQQRRKRRLLKGPSEFREMRKK